MNSDTWGCLCLVGGRVPAVSPSTLSSLQKWAMRLISRQSQIELTLAASTGLDGDGGSGYLGEDSVFDFYLGRSAVTGLDGGMQAPDQLSPRTCCRPEMLSQHSRKLLLFFAS